MRRLLAAALCAAVVAGCGDDDQMTRAAPATQPTPATTESTTTTTTTASTQAEATADSAADGGDEPARPGAGAATPEEAARAVLTTAGGPEQACRSFVTTAFIQISYGGRQNCVASRTPNALAESIQVRSSKKTRGGVHLVVVPDGGPYDGAKVEVDVIVDHGTYRVDSLQAHVPAGP